MFQINRDRLRIWPNWHLGGDHRTHMTEPSCPLGVKGPISDICGMYHDFYMDLHEIFDLNRDPRQYRPNWHHGGDITVHIMEPCCCLVLKGPILDICGMYHDLYIDLYEIIQINRDLQQIRPNWHHGGDYHNPYDGAMLSADAKTPYFGYLRYVSWFVYWFIRNNPDKSRSTPNQAELRPWRWSTQHKRPSHAVRWS
jgi:hypothetical protein